MKASGKAMWGTVSAIVGAIFVVAVVARLSVNAVDGSSKTVPAGAGFRQGLWQSFTVQDGLPSSDIRAILQDREGYLWFGTAAGGVSRYDGHEFVTFTTDDGLVNNSVSSIVEDRQGNLWFGTEKPGASRHDGQTTRQRHVLLGKATRLGVSRYDGQTFTTFTTEDGLAYDDVSSIVEDRQGNLWFGTGWWPAPDVGGVSRYDGQTFTSFTTEEGLVHNTVWSMSEDREGNLWFGTLSGVSRYDGETFTSFTTEEGLADNKVRAILEDREGHLWFGTNHNLSRYDGKEFTTFTTEDGLGDGRENDIRSIVQDRQGHLWFGTADGGVSRYDGKTFTTFTTEDGLANNWVQAILEDREGNLWFGTGGGGVSRYGTEDLSTLGAIAGRVTHARDGSPWAEAVIRVDDQEGRMRARSRTDSDGRYQVWVAPGSYRASVVGAGRATQAEDAVAEDISVGAGDNIGGVDFAPTSRRSIP